MQSLSSSFNPAAGTVCCIMPPDLWPPLSGTNVWSYTAKAPPAEWGSSGTCSQQSHQGKRERESCTWQRMIGQNYICWRFFLFLSPLTRSCDSLRLWWVDLHTLPGRMPPTAAIRQQLITLLHLHTWTLYYQHTLLATSTIISLTSYTHMEITHHLLPVWPRETLQGSWWMRLMRRNFLPFRSSQSGLLGLNRLLRNQRLAPHLRASSPVWADFPCSAVCSWWPRGGMCVKRRRPRQRRMTVSGRIQLCRTVSASPVMMLLQFAIQLHLIAANQYRPSHLSAFDQCLQLELLKS